MSNNSSQIDSSTKTSVLLPLLSTQIFSAIYLHMPKTPYCTRWYGVKGTKVDQSCFNDPVKWIKAQVSEPPS